MALQLGYPTPRHLVQHLTSEDITNWRAYDVLEPFGQPRMDRLLGTVVAQFFNANREQGSDAKMWFDFFPNADMPQAEEKLEAVQDQQQANESALLWVKSYNTRLKEHEEKEAQAKAVRDRFEAKAIAQANREKL